MAEGALDSNEDLSEETEEPEARGPDDGEKVSQVLAPPSHPTPILAL